MCVSMLVALMSSCQKRHNENMRKCDIDGQPSVQRERPEVEENSVQSQVTWGRLMVNKYE